MMRTLFWMALAVGAALLQSSWPDALKVQGVVPDLVLLLVVYFAMSHGAERAMYAGAIGGLYQDVATTSILGHHVLCHVVAAYVTARVASRLLTDHPAIKAVLVLLAALGDGVLFTMVTYVREPNIGFLYTVVAVVVPTAFYTAVLTPLAFAVLGLVFERRERLQGGVV